MAEQDQRLKILLSGDPMPLPRTIEWIDATPSHLRLLDQTRLPTEIVYRDCRDLESVRQAICELCVRGAPAIGVSAAYALVLWLQGRTAEDASAGFDAACERLHSSRPTAVNLAWALERMRRRWQTLTDQSAGNLVAAMLAEAHAIAAEDEAMCAAMGRHGATLITDGCGVLTHCNTGSLATAGMGTALAALFTAAQQGKRFSVYADETRPLLQGARLTAWELRQAGIDVTLICDSMAAQVMKEGRVQLVIVGADRIAANGDTANKIGTYGVAVLARAHNIPFYVAAPSSTFDLSLPSGAGIPIEQRHPGEVTHGFGRKTAPDGVRVYNPAFDLTPAELIAGIITENGIIRPVTTERIKHAIMQGQLSKEDER
jgi:methylthioribose-1-phosphate isomerase